MLRIKRTLRRVILEWKFLICCEIRSGVKNKEKALCFENSVTEQ